MESPESASARIRDFAEETRERVRSERCAPSVQFEGRLDDNQTASRLTDAGLRRLRGGWGEMAVGKPLSDRFGLLIKHNALFAALLPRLVESFACLAIVWSGPRGRIRGVDPRGGGSGRDPGRRRRDLCRRVTEQKSIEGGVAEQRSEADRTTLSLGVPASAADAGTPSSVSCAAQARNAGASSSLVPSTWTTAHDSRLASSAYRAPSNLATAGRTEFKSSSHRRTSSSGITRVANLRLVPTGILNCRSSPSSTSLALSGRSASMASSSSACPARRSRARHAPSATTSPY